ncbi:Gx transporter family protein [uncultured Subdoligranulum sp.]|uniref:Gx transporter family protein n=1 Tax=uncultured Subdoligranulum sp. TaxID=512298 RepID=UPI0032085FFC
MNKTQRLARAALLTALALGLSWMERFIPLQLLVPLPGIKLGLANLVTLFALYFLGGRMALAILCVRCLLGSLFGGGVTAFCFSIIGGLLALAVMALARRLPVLSVYGVSILGAAAHHVGQILVAVALLRSGYVVAYLPFLLLVAIATGFLTGAISSALFRAMLAADLPFLSQGGPSC